MMRKRMIGLVILPVFAVMIISGAGCGMFSRKTSAPQKSYYVLKGETKVLWMTNVPGYLVSSGYFPDHPLTKHPFLNAKALEPDEEDLLGTLLRDSKSFDEYVRKLKQNGYRVVEEQE